MDEQWREIPDTHYSVSDFGRVVSRYRGGRILRPGNRNGYLMVVLQGNGNVLYRSIHILVATAFLGPRPTPRHQVNHKNGIRIDNRVENLEWVTARENKQGRAREGPPSIQSNRDRSARDSRQVRGGRNTRVYCR